MVKLQDLKYRLENICSEREGAEGIGGREKEGGKRREGKRGREKEGGKRREGKRGKEKEGKRGEKREKEGGKKREMNNASRHDYRQSKSSFGNETYQFRVSTPAWADCSWYLPSHMQEHWLVHKTPVALHTFLHPFFKPLVHLSLGRSNAEVAFVLFSCISGRPSNMSSTTPSLQFVPLKPYPTSGTPATGGDSSTEDLNVYYEVNKTPTLVIEAIMLMMRHSLETLRGCSYVQH